MPIKSNTEEGMRFPGNSVYLACNLNLMRELIQTIISVKKKIWYNQIRAAPFISKEGTDLSTFSLWSNVWLFLNDHCIYQLIYPQRINSRYYCFVTSTYLNMSLRHHLRNHQEKIKIEKSEKQKIFFSEYQLLLRVLRVFVLFCVFDFVRVILSWCH